MTSFDNALAGIERILSSAEATPSWIDRRDRAREMIERRGQIMVLIAELHSCLANDPRIFAAADQAVEMRKRLSEVRRSLSGLQARWRAGEILADYDGYREESKTVGRQCKNFVVWAQKVRLAA